MHLALRLHVAQSGAAKQSASEGHDWKLHELFAHWGACVGPLELPEEQTSVAPHHPHFSDGKAFSHCTQLV
jgi:hypothetical protein